MSQNSWIAVSIFIGFFVYITVKGQLPQYQAAIFNGKQTSSAAPPSEGGAGYVNPDPTVK